MKEEFESKLWKKTAELFSSANINLRISDGVTQIQTLVHSAKMESHLATNRIP